MADSIQRIVVHRALAGQCPQTREQIIGALEATSKDGIRLQRLSIGAANGMHGGFAINNGSRPWGRSGAVLGIPYEVGPAGCNNTQTGPDAK